MLTAGIGDTDVFDWAGILSALIGVVIVLLVAGYAMRRPGGAHGDAPPDAVPPQPAP